MGSFALDIKVCLVRFFSICLWYIERDLYGRRLKEMFINTEFLKNDEIQLMLERTVEGENG